VNNFIDIEAITIAPNRTRRIFNEGDLRTLVESIETNGLLHAPVLRLEENTYVLIAGERRLRAIRDIYDMGGHFKYSGNLVVKGMVPFTSLGDLGPIESLEAELEENIRRADLTWQERAQATSDLMKLREAQAERDGTARPTVADIAVEVRDSAAGWNHAETKKEIILARHLDDPEVRAAKTSDEAFKLLIRKEQAAKSAALGAAVGRTFTSQLHTLIQGDSQSWLESCPPDSFDVILTDPPYGMGADEFGDSGGAILGGAHGYADSRENFLSIMAQLPTQLFRITKPEAHLYLFCDIDWFAHLKTEFTVVGWKVFRTPLIWFKPSAFRAPWPDQGPQRKYEAILFAVKGNRKTLKLAGDVITCPPDENLGHAAQKPVELFRELLSRSARPGDTVLDPYCGSGPIFPAAHSLKVAATGIEQDASAHGIAAKRVQELT
jgi:site-specific DNA-methyltransferase (adenine-specific)